MLECCPLVLRRLLLLLRLLPRSFAVEGAATRINAPRPPPLPPARHRQVRWAAAVGRRCRQGGDCAAGLGQGLPGHEGRPDGRQTGARPRAWPLHRATAQGRASSSHGSGAAACALAPAVLLSGPGGQRGRRPRRGSRCGCGCTGVEGQASGGDGDGRELCTACGLQGGPNPRTPGRYVPNAAPTPSGPCLSACLPACLPPAVAATSGLNRAVCPGTTAEEAASSFVNPLTALGMVSPRAARRSDATVYTAAFVMA